MGALTSDELVRFSRQIRFEPLGLEGQRRLRATRALVVGVGALGSAVAERLVRAGVGFVRVVDRDVVELSNLQRQSLYTLDDVAACRPKVIALQRHLAAIDPAVTVEPVVMDVTRETILPLFDGIDVVADGADNFLLRHAVNEVAVATATPWVYAGVAGATGMLLPILPGVGPCLKCILEEDPDPAHTPTAHTEGIIASLPAVFGALEAAELVKIVVDPDTVRRRMLVMDLWEATTMDVRVERRPGCPVCGG